VNITSKRISEAIRLAVNLLSVEDSLAQRPLELSEYCGMEAEVLAELFRDEIGISPLQFTLNERLDFSRTLVRETGLPIQTIAEISGYSSIENYEIAFLSRFRRRAQQVSRRRSRTPVGTITLPLAFRPPFSWAQTIGFFRAHGIPGLEATSAGIFERLLRFGDSIGSIRVFSALNGRPELTLESTGVPASELFKIVKRVRWMFDLDMDPIAVAEGLSSQDYSAVLYKCEPGLRIAKGWNSFETAVATVLGQLVSVQFGRVLLKELIDAYGQTLVDESTSKAHTFFPTPERLQTASLKEVRTSERRRECIRALARVAADEPSFFALPHAPKKVRDRLKRVPGIGAWTAEYVAMRAFGDQDAFPSTDYGLKQELALNSAFSVNAVRPLRAYAAVYMWKEFLNRKEATNATRL
jgi:3-methyladenine DNA glycosylase/8-oxoguanine DNA glycosylase/AraC-like DNA-binding protein